MADLTPPSSNPASPLSGGKNNAAQTAVGIAKTSWAWTKKAIAFAWPRLKTGGKVIAKKVDAHMDKLIESINRSRKQPTISGGQSAAGNREEEAENKK